MTSRAEIPLVRGRCQSENLTSALLCERNEKERQTTKQKIIVGQVVTCNSNNFDRLNTKLDQERNKNVLGKPIQKIEKTVKIKVKLPQVNRKPLARSEILFKHRCLTLL